MQNGIVNIANWKNADRRDGKIVYVPLTNLFETD